MCVTDYSTCFRFIFSLKMSFVLVWFVVFFYWSCDSVSNSKHGHWNLCCSKRFSLPQTTKKQSWPQNLTELLEWRSNKIWANDPSSHIVRNVKSSDFFVLLAAHTVSFHCVRGKEKDLEDLQIRRLLKSFSTSYT